MIDICIPTYKRPHDLALCLSHILNIAEHINIVYIMITGEQKDSINLKTKQVLTALSEKTSLFIKDGMTGILGAKKTFLSLSDSEVSLFLDDDAMIMPNYLSLVDHFKDKKVGAVSGSLITPENILDYSTWSLQTLELDQFTPECNKIVESGEMLVFNDKYQVFRIESPYKYLVCEFLVGTALFVRNSLVEIDMNYERSTACGEEFDFTYNMFKKGYELRFDPRCLAYHLPTFEGGNRLRNDPEGIKENWEYFCKKWGFKATRSIG